MRALPLFNFRSQGGDGNARDIFWQRITYVLPCGDTLLVCLVEGLSLDGHFEGPGLSEFNQGDVANA